MRRTRGRTFEKSSHHRLPLLLRPSKQHTSFFGWTPSRPIHSLLRTMYGLVSDAAWTSRPCLLSSDLPNRYLIVDCPEWDCQLILDASSVVLVEQVSRLIIADRLPPNKCARMLYSSLSERRDRKKVIAGGKSEPVAYLKLLLLL